MSTAQNGKYLLKIGNSAVAIEDQGAQWRTLPVRDASAARLAIETANLRLTQVDGLNRLVQNVSP